MKLNHISVQKLLMFTAVGLTALLVSIGFITNYYLQRSFSQYALLSEVDRVAMLGQQIRKAEKDFLLIETINPEFYRTGKSEYIALFDSLARSIDSSLVRLSEVDANLSTADIKAVESSFAQYKKQFAQLTALTRTKGFKDFGIEGDFRSAIHSVEQELEQRNDYKLTVYMLTLRRHEKDYLLRKELRYRDKFTDVNAKLIRVLSDGSRNTTLIELLKRYESLFYLLIDKDIAIGLTGGGGVLADINQVSQSMENGLDAIHTEVYNMSKAAIQNAVVALFVAIIVLSVIAVALILRISSHIVRSIHKLQRYILKLGQGELPEAIAIDGSNEITQMADAVNILTNNLKRTQTFAIEVGNGNFESEVNVFNNQGDLGGALIEMRAKLLQVAQEREQSRMADSQRLWVNEGLALFAQLLRGNGEHSLQELSFLIVKNMVKYTGSNQGALFLVDDEDSSTINLVSAFAYDRRKYLKKSMHIREGLVGVCVLEAETTLITDIPEGYLQITSGLGQASPNCLLLVPLKTSDSKVYGVVEIASFNVLEPYQIDFLERVAENVASTIQMVKVNERTAQLLEQTQSQAEILAAQEEEMRQNLEELQATQESLSQRELELRNDLVAKDEEIEQLRRELVLGANSRYKHSQWLEGLLVAIEGAFLFAELNAEGVVERSNNLFAEAWFAKDASEISIFDGSIPERIDENRMDWERIVKGEAYIGSISRVSSNGRTVSFYCSVTPFFEGGAKLQKVVFIGMPISDNMNHNQMDLGKWVRDFNQEHLVEYGDVCLS